MAISFHQIIDDAICMLMALCSKMEIDHGGVQAVMAQILLDATDVDSGFQQMSSIAVAQGMNGDTFVSLSCLSTRLNAPCTEV